VIDIDPEVARWASDLLDSSVTVSHLAGGGNNHLFRCSTASRGIVIKRYREQNFGSEVTRREAETAFLRHAAVAAPRYVPELLATHDSLEMIAMSAIDGVPYQPGQVVGAEDLQIAVSFYQALNSDGDCIKRYPIAAREGFLSIVDHILHVEERLSRLSIGHLPVEVRAPAQRVLGEVRTSFDHLVTTTQAGASSSALWGDLDPEFRQLSPGDFGFHNALRSLIGPRFVDFEYAGVDDPAKTLADFFLQPKIAVDPAAFESIATAFSIRIPKRCLQDRARVLGRVLSTKWKAIILGPLDPARFAAFEARHPRGLAVELLNRLRLAERQTLFD
jgi:hypothetical protein